MAEADQARKRRWWQRGSPDAAGAQPPSRRSDPPRSKAVTTADHHQGVASAVTTLPASLEHLVRVKLAGMVHGAHRGVLSGSGSTLAEAREYQPGQDDVRAMDWAVTARTTVPHVRDTTPDRELNTAILADLSASMFFGTALCEKRVIALAAVAAFGFLATGQADRCDTFVASGDGFSPCRSARGHDGVRVALRELSAVAEKPATPQADLAAALDRLARVKPRRGLRVVVSDFHGTNWHDALHRLARRHQVMAVQVIDPAEVELPNWGVTDVVDPETGHMMEVNTGSKKVRQQFRAVAQARQEEHERMLRSAGILHLQLSTGRDWVQDIATFLHTSSKQQQAFGATIQSRGM